MQDWLQNYYILTPNTCNRYPNTFQNRNVIHNDLRIFTRIYFQSKIGGKIRIFSLKIETGYIKKCFCSREDCGHLHTQLKTQTTLSGVIFSFFLPSEGTKRSDLSGFPAHPGRKLHTRETLIYNEPFKFRQFPRETVMVFGYVTQLFWLRGSSVALLRNLHGSCAKVLSPCAAIVGFSRRRLSVQSTASRTQG